jgi:hypothetical protein
MIAFCDLPHSRRRRRRELATFAQPLSQAIGGLLNAIAKPGVRI